MRVPSVIAIVLLISVVGNAQVDTSTRTIIVNVFEKGSPNGPVGVKDLTAADFEVKVRGNPPVQSATYHHGPVRAVILFDVGRNQSRTEWETAAAISSKLAEHLPDNSELSLITFSDQVEQVLSPGTDRQKFVDALQRLSPVQKETNEDALLDALARGAQLLEPARPGDVQVFFFNAPVTGTRSRQKEEVMSLQLSEAGVRVLGVVFGASITPTSLGGGVAVAPNAARLPSLMTPGTAIVTEHPEWFSASERLAFSSGGMFVGLRPDPSGQKSSILQEEVATILNAFATNYYSLTLPCLPLKRAEDAQVKLKNKKLANASLLFYPTTLYPCAGH